MNEWISMFYCCFVHLTLTSPWKKVVLIFISSSINTIQEDWLLVANWLTDSTRTGNTLKLSFPLSYYHDFILLHHVWLSRSWAFAEWFSCSPFPLLLLLYCSNPKNVFLFIDYSHWMNLEINVPTVYVHRYEYHISCILT